MSIIAVIPTKIELTGLLEGFAQKGFRVERDEDERLPIHHISGLDLILAKGGLGKAQFGIQTQYLIDTRPCDLLICAGTAGALADELAIGDVVVATETIEHDIQTAGRSHVPRFAAADSAMALCRQALGAEAGFQVHFGPIASGDEDIVDKKRRAALRSSTGALAVAWEGAGGARSCRFSAVPFLEIRGITDHADVGTPTAFADNVAIVMQNVAAVLMRITDEPKCLVVRRRSTRS